MAFEKIEIENSGVLELVEGFYVTADGETKISEDDAQKMIEEGTAEIVSEKENPFDKKKKDDDDDDDKPGDDDKDDKKKKDDKGDDKDDMKKEESAQAKDIDLAPLFEGTDLSDEFKEKAATIFEAAVNDAVKVKLVAEKAELVEYADTAIAGKEEALSEKVAQFMDHATAKWLEENKLAVTYGLKNEITESFIAGLKDLFEESHIDVPEEKYDVMEALNDKADDLEEKYNTSENKVIDANETIIALKQALIFEKKTTAMTMTDKEKLADMMEDLKVEDVEQFGSKLDTLQESYFSNNDDTPQGNINEDLDKLDSEKNVVHSLVEQAMAVSAKSKHFN